MRIPEALDEWASENRDHLSLDTLGEVDIISRRVASSALASQPMQPLAPEQIQAIDALFGPERSERARLLIDVVATWLQQKEPNASTGSPSPAQLPIAPERVVDAAPVPTNDVVPSGAPIVPPAPAPLPQAPVAQVPPAPAPLPQAPIQQSGVNEMSGTRAPSASLAGAPTFLDVANSDDPTGAEFYGPDKRRSSASKTLIAAIVAVCLVGLIATVALLVVLTGDSDESDTSAVSIRESQATAAEQLPATEAPRTDEGVEGTNEPVVPDPSADSDGLGSEQVPESSGSDAATDAGIEATAPIRTWWADTTTVLNAGSVDILASTYNVSPANRAVLIGHTAAITGIVVAEDGRVLTSGADQRLVDWGADVTAANPDVLEVDATLTALTRTQDHRLVAGDGLGNITVINLTEGGNPQVIPVHPVAVSTIAEVAVGTLAVGSVDGAVSIFPLDDPTAVQVLEHPVEVTGVALLDDARIATSSVDGFVRLWNQAGGEPETIRTHDRALTALTALSNGRIATADVTGEIHVVSAQPGATKSVALVGHNGPVRTMLQLDETTLASGGDDSTLRIWNIGTGAQLRVLDGHGDLISALDTLPDQRLVSTSADGTARVWDLTLPAEAPVEPPHTLNVSDIAGWANDQLVTGGDDGKVMLISTSITTAPTLITQHAGSIVGVEVMPNRDIVSLDALSSLRLSDASGDGEPLFETTIAAGATALATRGSSGVVTGHADGTVRFTDFTTEIAVVNAHGSGVNDVVALSNGLILSAGQDRTVRVIDLEDDTDRLPVFDLHTAPVDVVVELPDGRVASAGSDGIYIWTTSELGRDHVRLDGHRSQITSLFGLPGNRLLSTARDGRIRLWNLDDPDAAAVTLVDVPGVVNPVLAQAGNGLFVSGAARGYVTFAFEG